MAQHTCLGSTMRCALILSIVACGMSVPARAQSDEAISSQSAVPDCWIANEGQWRPSIGYAMTSGSAVVQLERGGLRLLLPAVDGSGRVDALRLGLVGPGGACEPRAVGQRDEVYHFLLGSDEQGWHGDVSAHDTVAYDGIAPGVDLTLLPRGNGVRLRFASKDGAALGGVALAVEGIDGLSHAVDGAWTGSLSHGAQLKFRVGQSWGTRPDGTLREVPCTLDCDPQQTLRMDVAQEGAQLGLIVELALEWSTIQGGSVGEVVQALALDEAGGTVVGGLTNSFDFPVTEGALDTEYGGGTGSSPKDIYLARYSSTGRLQWATFLGGSNNEEVAGLHVADDGRVLVGGWTVSLDFPTTSGAFAPEPFFGGGAFACALTPDGKGLDFGTYLGGNSVEQAADFIVDSDGNLILVGWTASTDFPTTPNAIQSKGGGFPQSAFISRLSPDASELTYSTYLGCSGGAFARAAALGPDGELVIVGSAMSSCLAATPNALYGGDGGTEVFVATIDPEVGDLLALTYLGIENGLPVVAGVGVDGHGRIVVGGSSGGSGPFPFDALGLDTSFNGLFDAYVAKLDRRLTTLLYGTFIGGSKDESPSALAVERSGAVVLAGTDRFSELVPTTPGALQTEPPGGGLDAFVMRLSPDGDRLDYSTYLGGSKWDSVEGRGVAVGPLGRVTVGGATESSDFPGISEPLNGSSDAFVARLSMLPTGVTRYGWPSPAEGRWPYLGVAAMPALGAADFAITCSEAPASGGGFLLLAAEPVEVPTAYGAADVWVNLHSLVALVPLATDHTGYGEVPLRILDEPALLGLQVHAQAVWPSVDASPRHGASNALALVVQP